ncbi:MAG: hypothetical protein FWE15_07805 [Actinomycetia bacterium]|nr:hypothetical protein [Actinomycetes bacterium]
MRRPPHRLPFLLAVLAVWAAAGCTTVSAPPPPAPAARTARPVSPQPVAARRPDGGVPQPRAHQVLDTAGARPVGSPHPSAARVLPVRGAAGPHRPAHHREPGRAGVPPMPAMPRLPGGSGVCDLGRVYGGWDAGSAAARACRRAVGPAAAPGTGPTRSAR